MSRYRWPSVTRKESGGDEPGERGGFVRRIRSDFDPEGARAASLAARAPRPHAGGPGPFAPPSGRNHLWQPLGPMTVVHNYGYPRVSGRVNMLAVHSGGLRVYAASANGGVWYTNDGAMTWRSLGGFAPTAAGEIVRPIQRHTCGAIAVSFGATEADDHVFVGTGEHIGPHDVQPPSFFGGIGILVADQPATNGGADPWTREAKNLLGRGVSRIALQPGTGAGVVAATTIGLFQRPAPGVDNEWPRVAGEPFSSLTVACADVLWTRAAGPRPERLWVWVRDGSQAGLWVRAAGETDFTKVATEHAASGRAVLAPAEPPDQIFLFYDKGKNVDPLLFRIACATAAAPVATLVAGVPNVLTGQGYFDIALAVHPTKKDRVVVGGSTFDTRTPDGGFLVGDAAVLAADVGLAAGVGVTPGDLTFGQPAPGLPATMIGAGAHADVHDLAYSNNGDRLWLACDGGVFRSDHPTKLMGFFAVNDGLPVVESNYVANHPTCEGYVVAGLQDNGVLGRRSTGVWRTEDGGDCGGVVFDPIRPSRYLRQFTRGKWDSSEHSLSVPFRADSAAFYSTPAGIGHRRGVAATAPPNVGQIIVGTNRVWYTDDFGLNWCTLPTGEKDANKTTDDFGAVIRVCRWQSPDVAWILSEGILKRYARQPGTDADQQPGTWSVGTVLPSAVAAVTVTPESVRKKRRKRRQQQPPPPDPPSAEELIGDSGVWTDIAVNLDAGSVPHGTLGAVYLGTIGNPVDGRVDTLWWFDGTSTWYSTGLRTNAVPAPVTAIVCDPEHPDEVWVGTTVGVWRGVRSQTGNNPPTWTWDDRLNGLPEAAVEDLAIFSDGGLRLLRAAISARGVWELRLDVADVSDLTYVRAHDDDLRYRTRAVEKHRDMVMDRSWHGSPDVRPRRAPLSCPAPNTLPWMFPIADTEPLRRFQCALRSRTGDPRVRPTGDWDIYFNELLRELDAPLMPLPAPLNTVCIDATFWNLSMTAPHATAEAWGDGRPSEADLYDYTNRLGEGALEEASCEMPPERLKVDVVVHHRGLDLAAGASVRVTLLQWIDPKSKGKAKWDDRSTWFTAAVPWTPAVNQVLNSADGTTSHAMDNGWAFVFRDATTHSHRITLDNQTVDSTHAGIATFDIDLENARPNLFVLLVAVIHVDTLPDLALSPATLQDLALTSPNVAVRSIRVNKKP